MTRIRLGTIRLVALFAMLALAFAGAAEAKKDKRYRDQMFKVSVERDIVYGNAAVGPYDPNQELLLDLYKPKKDKVKRRPAIVWVHGGSFCCGDKGFGPSPQLAKYFARRGYVTVSINYRFLVNAPCSVVGGSIPIECFQAAIQDTHDAQAAVRYLRANAKQLKIDPERIAAGGESAGGIIASGVGVLSAQPGESGNPGFPSDVGAFASISGGLPGGLFVDADTAPGIFFASTNDPIVPYAWSPETVDAMTALGITAKLTPFDSSVHVPWDDFRPVIEKQTRNFFYKQLDLKHAAS